MNTKLDSLIKFLLTVDKSAALELYDIIKTAGLPFDPKPEYAEFYIPQDAIDNLNIFHSKQPGVHESNPSKPETKLKRQSDGGDKDFSEIPEHLLDAPQLPIIGYLPGEVMSGRAEKIFNILKDKYQKGDQIDTGEEQGLFDPTSINQEDDAGKEFSVPGKLDTEISAKVVDDNGNKKLILGPA